MVMEGTALEFLPWESKGLDGLEIPRAHTYIIMGMFQGDLSRNHSPPEVIHRAKLQFLLTSSSG
jgi:hypothetical protein